MSKKNSDPTVYVGFRVTKDILVRIDNHAKRLIRATPWIHSPRTGRSDAVRDLLLLALDGVEMRERAKSKAVAQGGTK